MSSITEEFAATLSTVSRPGAFCVGGTEPMLAPGLSVEGIGPIALPLLPVQAEQLIAAAERAPYGRGEDTLTDIAVRRTWQISADRLRIEGKRWPQTLEQIVARVADRLGVADPVEAHVYKLLVYDQGSFFVSHRDTEKMPGMFATLVLALPSLSEGGELIVRHMGREARLDLQCEDPSEIAFAAFYADCVHEVLPVTAGYRLVLVYNLVRRGRGRLPKAPNYHDEQEAVATLLRQWAAVHDAIEPEKLIFQLEHAYTPAELDFRSLKGADAGIAEVVVAAAERAGCDVHLALVSVEENGIAEHTGDGHRSRRGRYGDDDDDEFEVVEVNERIAVASQWRRPDGEPSPLTDLPVLEEEFSPPLSFEELEPDEEHFHEATGNEGASFERTYSRAALILWPRDRVLAVINQAGPKVTLPFLADLTDRWVAGGADRASGLRLQARALTQHMIATWQMGEWYPRSGSDPTDAGRFLDLMLRLGDTAGLEALLTTLAARGGLAVGDCAAIAAALHALPPERAVLLARTLVEGAAETAFGACANLLARASGLDPTVVTSAARSLVASLPGDPARVSTVPQWRRDPAMHPNFIADLFIALGRIDATLAVVSADHVLDWPKTYDFDTVLVPAVGTLLDTPESGAQPAVQRLRTACIGHLDTRIALPLEAPSDWQRNARLGCSCDDCRALGLYLGDPTKQTWVFAAAEPRRRHVENTIRHAACDVDTRTERRGSPHRLHCIKNQASYERRCVQRASDLAERARLVG
jgi:hypothetical protein